MRVILRRPGQLGGIGSELTEGLERLAGGAARKVTGKLDQVELALKISTVASLVAAGAAIVAAIASTTRR